MAWLLLAAASLNVWVLIGILAAAFAVQLIAGEPPCPLCVAQRIALMMCALGPLHMLRGSATAHLLRAMLPPVAASPSSPPWWERRSPRGRCCFISCRAMPGSAARCWGFTSIPGASSLSSARSRPAARCCWLKEERIRWRFGNVTAGGFVVVVAANLLSVIAEAGLNWDLPSNPVGYLLFK